jgi:hypothetical protein
MTAVHSDTDGRNSIIKKLQSGIDDLERAIETANPETVDEQQLQLRRYHELGYLANQYRKLTRDTDLVEIDERLELLERDPEDD